MGLLGGHLQLVGLTVRQGKASLWVQTRLRAWQRNGAEHGFHETAVRLSSTGSDTADGAGSSPRVLPWIGASSMALVLLLGTMACSMPSLGGLQRPLENGEVLHILNDLVTLVAITTIGLRLDCNVEGIFSCMPTFAVLSRGLPVALEVKDGHLDLSPLAVDSRLWVLQSSEGIPVQGDAEAADQWQWAHQGIH